MNGTYYFIYDNGFEQVKEYNKISKDVPPRITSFWSETAYREVTLYYPLFSHEYTYVSMIILYAGIGAIIIAFINV